MVQFVTKHAPIAVFRSSLVHMQAVSVIEQPEAGTYWAKHCT